MHRSHVKVQKDTIRDRLTGTYLFHTSVIQPKNRCPYLKIVNYCPCGHTFAALVPYSPPAPFRASSFCASARHNRVPAGSHNCMAPHPLLRDKLCCTCSDQSQLLRFPNIRPHLAFEGMAIVAGHLCIVLALRRGVSIVIAHDGHGSNVLHGFGRGFCCIGIWCHARDSAYYALESTNMARGGAGARAATRIILQYYRA